MIQSTRLDFSTLTKKYKQILYSGVVVSQMVIEGLLGPLGFKLTPAMDGDEALTIMHSREYIPDLILLDVQMPIKTGYEVRFPNCFLLKPPSFAAA